jgi:hypothetical protein
MQEGGVQLRPKWMWRKGEGVLDWTGETKEGEGGIRQTQLGTTKKAQSKIGIHQVGRIFFGKPPSQYCLPVLLNWPLLCPLLHYHLASNSQALVIFPIQSFIPLLPFWPSPLANLPLRLPNLPIYPHSLH